MNLSGSPSDYIFAFLGGIAVSFTPCVYPLIPVSVSYIGAKSTSRRRGFVLSLVYVSGIALTYSILGLIASLTGKLFGSLSSHPFAYILVGLVICLFGFSMFGLPKVSFNSGPKVSVPYPGAKNYVSVFILGITSGFIVSPCLTPVLGSILSYLATRKNIFYGMSLLVSFAYGMGLILILSGTFSGFLSNIPKSGKWMVYFQKLAGVVLLVTGIYFIYSGIRRFQ